MNTLIQDFKRLDIVEKFFMSGLAICILLIPIIGMTIYNHVGAEITVERVQIVDKMYTPSSTSTGVATGVTSNGNVGTGMVVSGESEKYTLLVKYKNEVFSQEVSADRFTRYEKGDKIRVHVAHGALFADTWLIFD